MERLASHIEYLLLHHDCVVIPDIGAFINVRQSARYDSETSTWTPMNREIRFNPVLIHDDGLIVTSYARKYQISFEEGRELLNKDITLLNVTLSNEGEISLGSIGTLLKIEEKVSFYPSQISKSLFQHIGYVEVNDDCKTKKSFNENQKVINKDLQLSNIAEQYKRNFNTDKNYYIPINKSFAKISACICVLLSISLAVLFPMSRRDEDKQASVLPVEHLIDKSKSLINDSVLTGISDLSKIDSDGTTDVKLHDQSNDIKVDSLHEDLIAEPNTQKLNHVIEEKIIDKNSPKYHLIVATFKTSREAENYIKVNSKKDSYLYIIRTSTMSRVSAKKSDNRDALIKILNSDKFHANYPDAWIWAEK